MSSQVAMFFITLWLGGNIALCLTMIGLAVASGFSVPLKAALLVVTAVFLSSVAAWLYFIQVNYAGFWYL